MKKLLLLSMLILIGCADSQQPMSPTPDKAYAAAMRYRVPLEWGIACRTAGILPEAVSGEWIVWLELWIDNNLNF